MDGEQSLVGEEIERTAPRPGAHHHAIDALVQEGAGLLSVARRDEVADLPFADLDGLGHGAGGHFDSVGEPFVSADRYVVAKQDAAGPKHLLDGSQDVGAAGLESGREQLRDHDVAVAVHHEGGKSVRFGVNHAERGRVDGRASAPLGGLPNPPGPPGQARSIAV